MKIACIALARIPYYTANSIQVMKTCQAMTQLGHEVTLVAFDNPDAGGVQPWGVVAEFYGLQTRFEIIYFPFHKRGFIRRMFPWRALRKALSLKPDLLYVWPVQSAVGGLLLRKPVILEIHDRPTGQLGPIWYRIFLRLSGRKRLVLITKALQKALEQTYPDRLPEEQVVIAPNGVDLERFEGLPDSQDARQTLGFPDQVTVACTGHLYAGRGVDLFLGLASDIPEAHFLWAGGHPDDVKTWRERAVKAGADNVTFTGFVPNQDLPLYQAAADILLMPYGATITGSSGGNSADICSPMKMFEYLATGRAIISSDLAVIREVLHEENAIFCPPEDLPAWKEALGELITSPEKRAALAEGARNDAKQYSWAARSEKILQGFI
ncbi:MAG: glycosyltransferase family 4 protein [Anaerolineales bacterium]